MGGTVREKREFRRIALGKEISLVSNGYFFRDKLIDLSEGGAQLELNSALPLGRDIMIKAPFGRKKLIAIADIRWKKVLNGTMRVGVKFWYLPPRERNWIRKRLC